jgi:hypothetical protein
MRILLEGKKDKEVKSEGQRWTREVLTDLIGSDGARLEHQIVELISINWLRRSRIPWLDHVWTIPNSLTTKQEKEEMRRSHQQILSALLPSPSLVSFYLARAPKRLL